MIAYKEFGIHNAFQVYLQQSDAPSYDILLRLPWKDHMLKNQNYRFEYFAFAISIFVFFVLLSFSC